MWLNNSHFPSPQHLSSGNNTVRKALLFQSTTERGLGAQCPWQERLRWHWDVYLNSTVSEPATVVPCSLTWPSDRILHWQYPTSLFPATIFKQGEEHKHSNFCSTTAYWGSYPSCKHLHRMDLSYPPLVQSWALLHLDCSPLLPSSLFPPAPHCSSPLLALVPAVCCQFLDKSHPQFSSCLLHHPLPHPLDISLPNSHLARRASSGSSGAHSWREKHS